MSSRITKAVSNLHILQSSVKWHHMEHSATSLWDTYSGLISNQAMILALNSSFVDPVLQFETQLKIINSSFKMAFAVTNLDEVREIRMNEDDEDDIESLYRTILNLFEDTLLILVSKDVYKLQILKEMVVWMNEDNSYMQEEAMVVISRVLSFAARKVKGSASVNAPCLGVLAAELSLLCSHSDPSITQQAFVGMYHLLCIAKCQSEGTAKSKNKKYDKPENHCIQPSSSGTEFLPKNLQKDKSKIAQSVGKTLLPPLLTDFVWSLLMKLSVPDQTIASEAATILTLTLECNAHKVTMVSKIVDTIYKQLCGDDSPILREAMLRVITLLTRTSPKKVIFQLMDYPVPADDILILMWYAAGAESSVVPHVLKTILLILKGKPREMEKITERKHFSLNATNMMPVAASQALCTLLPLGPYKKAVAQFFPQLLMALMLQLFYSSNLRLMTEDRPFYARDALRVLLNCSGLQEVDTALNRKNCWNQFSQVLFHHHGVYLVAKTLSEYKFPQFPETLHYLYKLAVEGPRRSEDSVITITFLTELLNNFFKDPFPEKFLVLFRNWVNDPDPAVCKLSLQKIASMAPVINEIENVCSLLTSILDAFLSKDTTVIIRALITLRKLLDRLDKVTYSSLFTRIASSYCPLMDHANGGIRSMAIHHFGQLLMDMSQYTWMLNDVVNAGLVPLILFLEDTEERVVKLISHQKYITDLISETLGFLESSRRYLKRGSVILLGYLAKLGGHLLLRDEIDVMIEAIDRVIRDEDPVIRELAEITNKIFLEIAHKLTTSTIKQSFQRLFNFIYLKKLKLLYNYNLTKNLTGSPMGIKEIRSDKEAIISDHYEDGLVKNEGFPSALEHSSEEK
ncbi:maestro heat-like repeat-containing protein family member 9 isoform X3 [Odocoileus virginianus]|uniref:Maestro heat-like repeat-containing protein family member 9 isoform X3 n=1 Tax=Odocoileus virginianus TaxID=9874 RepID=A0A6J0WXK6_ODOVR